MTDPCRQRSVGTVMTKVTTRRRAPPLARDRILTEALASRSPFPPTLLPEP
jgi:hypothetical protein